MIPAEVRKPFTKKWDFSRRPGVGREPCLTFDEIVLAIGIKSGQVRTLIAVHRIQPVFWVFEVTAAD